MIFGIALIGEHQAVAVDDAGGGGQQCARATHFRLQVEHLLGRQPDEIIDPVGRRLVLDLGQGPVLRLIGRDDQLAAAFERHALPGGVVVEHRLAGNAGPRLQGACRIVDAGMDDLAVSRTGARADHIGGFDDDRLDARHRERTRNGEPDHAGHRSPQPQRVPYARWLLIENMNTGMTCGARRSATGPVRMRIPPCMPDQPSRNDRISSAPTPAVAAASRISCQLVSSTSTPFS